MTARAREAATPAITAALARTPAKAMAVVRRRASMVAKARTTARGKVAANPVTTDAPARTLAKDTVAAKYPFPKTISNGCWPRRGALRRDGAYGQNVCASASCQGAVRRTL